LGYEEEIFTRSEKQFSRDEDRIEWLSSFGGKGGGNAYELAALKVGGELQSSLNITSEAKKSTSLSELQSLSVQASKLKFGKDEPLGIINDRIERIAKEEAEQQLKESGKLETVYRNKFKDVNTVSDVNEILSEAKRELPDSSYNRIKENADQMKRKLKQEAHQELMDKQQKDKEEKLAEEKLAEEKRIQKASEDYETKRQESIRIQRERELAKEIEREERRIAEEMAENE
jgi:hypothetical protein